MFEIQLATLNVYCLQHVKSRQVIAAVTEHRQQMQFADGFDE